MSESVAKVNALVLDATPLITQSASAIQQFAEKFYTTPGVHSELRDEHSRNQLLLWADKLQVRQPKPESIQKVSHFSRLTGDYAVLSLNDIHIIALAYELELEANGNGKLREYPGEKKEGDEEATTKPAYQRKEYKPREPEPEEEPQSVEEDDGFVVVKKPQKNNWKRKGKFQAKPQEAAPEPVPEPVQEPTQESEPVAVETVEEAVQQEQTQQEVSQLESGLEQASLEEKASDVLNEEYEDDDDDGDWITPQNFKEEMLKDSNERVQEIADSASLQVALSTGDFACQNVAMQLGLSLMNSLSGREIRRVRNYMFRCHACFRLTPIPKDGKPKHFCPKCGGNTLIRCAVSIESTTGKITPHLRANFQWRKRGDIYSIASPLSKNHTRRQGRAGYQQNKENRHKSLQNPIILREDQKEYQQAIKDSEWQRRQNEKIMEQWIGGGSADNFVSPFMMNVKSSSVKVGRGRNANASKKRK
ncbi:D-site 20S pre-rRNA nuclease [Suhomyces tanzawaensis NRRL Y-17324]|uniref:20S-pre-rRNA D-site endonuclease NOB1 n=1 Tax=Suhomyces tanzawaensis NRRL Y-17324 TaxID=984487 RepID=A0A1E4SIB7_9ASCO|nr:D-site 20S pre-rRNA nuclease [Suhomyces tanzawaensis NRRL Y-17324]ODV79251.1 D-site 20S pre-rRNA nuclease [Suhomyces tanzawaensis NRRL Y-17324]